MLLAFVELDLGTMSHARLKVKAAAYTAYAAQAAWTERYDFCPCLLFITTTEARAVAFLNMLAALLQKGGRGGFYDNRSVNVSWFAAGACAMAREPYRALSELCWDDLTLSGGGLCLLADQLDQLIAAANPEQAKELLRLLIKDIRVHDQHTIIPTYRVPAAVRTMHGTVDAGGRRLNRQARVEALRQALVGAR